jgi:hypothetical protein
MNLIQSICCFFSSRCAGGEAESKKADQDGYTRDAVGHRSAITASYRNS